MVWCASDSGLNPTSCFRAHLAGGGQMEGIMRAASQSDGRDTEEEFVGFDIAHPFASGDGASKDPAVIECT